VIQFGAIRAPGFASEQFEWHWGVCLPDFGGRQVTYLWADGKEAEILMRLIRPRATKSGGGLNPVRPVGTVDIIGSLRENHRNPFFRDWLYELNLAGGLLISTDWDTQGESHAG